MIELVAPDPAYRDSYLAAADEFGGAPASPATQPGDAAQDLPWLDSLQGGAAGKWADTAGGADDERPRADG